MTTQQYMLMHSGGNSVPARKSAKGSTKGSKDASKKNLPNNGNALALPQGPTAFEMPSITTNGMKNIEQFIDKSMLDGKQWYRCKWQNCVYTTLRSDSIVRHMRKHTGERPYKCWFCSYATIQSSALKIHLRRHTGERPYLCEYANCGKRFAVRNTLFVHERTHTGFKPYKCTSCTYSCSDRCKLVSHMRKVHQLELDGPAKTNLPLLMFTSQHQQHHQQQQQPSHLASQLHLPSTPAFPDMNGAHIPSHPVAAAAAASSSHSLALVSSAMMVNGATAAGQLLPSQLMANYSHFSMPNSNNPMLSAASASNLQLKNPGTGTASSPFVPLNFLISNSENSQNTRNAISFTSVPAPGRTKRKTAAQKKAAIAAAAANASKYHFPGEPTTALDDVQASLKSDENSIKRVMILVDKRLVNNRTSYFCKWPNCAYETQRSDSIVRHIRSHTGERPYKCSYANCTYATIQRSTLNKHLTRHQRAVFNY